MAQDILNLLTVAALGFGLFFLFIGALGLWRLPDLYHRMHAASKCVTLGIAGMLLAAIFHLSAVATLTPEEAVADAGAVEHPYVPSAVAVITKAILVIVFQFVAAPIAAHMLARAAHLDRMPVWEGTLSDELAEDKGG